MWQAVILVVLSSTNTPDSSMDHKFYTPFKFTSEAQCKEWIGSGNDAIGLTILSARLSAFSLKIAKIKSSRCNPKPLEV